MSTTDATRANGGTFPAHLRSVPSDPQPDPIDHRQARIEACRHLLAGVNAALGVEGLAPEDRARFMNMRTMAAMVAEQRPLGVA